MADTLDQAEIIGSYYGTSIAKINPSGTQVMIQIYVDISQVPAETAQWLRDVYASPAAVTIQTAPPGYEPDLPRRGAPRKSK